jgi:hypothetical protein
MARKSGKRGSAIILLIVVAALAGGPSTATAAVSAPVVRLPVAAPVIVAVPLPLALDRASWAEASWAEE